MAQRVQILLVDDLDGGEATETVTFALDGKDYEIDLSTDNAEKLREALSPYAAAGRKTTRNSSGSGPRGTRTRGSGSDPDTAKIRAWAKENGYEVSDRGRISKAIQEAFDAAH